MKQKEENFLQRLGSRRSHRQIIAEILELCKKPQAKTRIMHRANLSYKSLQRYLKQLQTYQLLKKHHTKEMFSTTEKGLKFLERWTDLQQFLDKTPKIVLYSRKNKIQFIRETD